MQTLYEMLTNESQTGALEGSGLSARLQSSSSLHPLCIVSSSSQLFG